MKAAAHVVAGPSLLLMLWLPVACAGEQPKPPAGREPEMSEHAPVNAPTTGAFAQQFDRNPPPPVPALTRGGKIYAQRLGSVDAATGQAGGLLDIIDASTGAIEATITVYDNKRDPGLEGDVQDIFFAAMAFDATGRLIITNEQQRRFAVDVAARTSVPLP